MIGYTKDKVPPSYEAIHIVAHLRNCGGTMRLRPLLRGLAMDERAFVEAIIDLSDRFWIRIIWRKSVPETEEPVTRPYTDIDRLCVTFFGRRKFQALDDESL